MWLRRIFCIIFGHDHWIDDCDGDVYDVCPRCLHVEKIGRQPEYDDSEIEDE